MSQSTCISNDEVLFDAAMEPWLNSYQYREKNYPETIRLRRQSIRLARALLAIATDEAVKSQITTWLTSRERIEAACTKALGNLARRDILRHVKAHETPEEFACHESMNRILSSKR
jgi:hypothetical protein